MMEMTGLECAHGQLSRACSICELENEITRLKAELVEAKRYHEAYREEMAEGCRVMQEKFDALKEQSEHS